MVHLLKLSYFCPVALTSTAVSASCCVENSTNANPLIAPETLCLGRLGREREEKGSTVEYPFMTVTIGNQLYVPYNEVSLTQGVLLISGRNDTV